MRTVWQNAQNSKSSFRWVPPGSRRNVNWNLFTAISGIYWSQTLRNATGRLSAICCWCVFLWSKTSQNRPSHSRLNLKIFAVPYLGQNSSKFPPKPLLVEKLVSRTVYCRHFFRAVLSVSGFSWITNNFEFRYSVCPKPMSPKTGKNPAELSIAWQTECKSHEIRCPRYLAMN